jgi:hypothetical protein
MAVSVISGLLSSTVLTLVVIPCLYALFDSLAARVPVGRREEESAPAPAPGLERSTS